MRIDKTNRDFQKVIPDNGSWLFNGELFAAEVSAPYSVDVNAVWSEVSEDEKAQWELEHPLEDETTN